MYVFIQSAKESLKRLFHTDGFQPYQRQTCQTFSGKAALVIFWAGFEKQAVDRIQTVLLSCDFPGDSKWTEILDKNSNNVQCNFAFMLCIRSGPVSWPSGACHSESSQGTQRRRMGPCHVPDLVEHTASHKTTKSESVTWPGKSSELKGQR